MIRRPNKLLTWLCMCLLWSMPVQGQDGSTAVGSGKSMMLYGRIEEIAGQRGAKLPISLKALTPKMDTSQPARRPLQANTSAYSGSLAQSRLPDRVDPFPVDWRGVWGGTLKVYRAEFDPICWQFDADEANQEKAILKPGTTGDVNFEFSQTGSRIDLQPAQLIISVPIAQTRYADMLNQMLGGLMGGGGSGAASMAGMSVPYALHLGNLVQGTGVTGNQLQAKLLKNNVRQLAPGVVEQQVITYNADRSTNGNVRYTYSESVLRFYRQSSNQLYVQAAMVSYLPNGHFKDKVILVGTVTRGQTQNRMPDLNSLLKGLN